MRISDRLFASLMFFTRLPLWRIIEVPAEAFKHTVDFWPIAGWLTGGIMSITFILLLKILPLSVALIIAILARLLLTGALHEDGLADFCDGMGGGTSRERSLAIMKDSHIGTYGVLGLIVYFFLLFTTITEVAINQFWCIGAILLYADVYAKCVASFIILLPYARDEESSKAHVVYQKRTADDTLKHLLRIAIALSLPVGILFYTKATFYILPLIVPILVFSLLLFWIKKKIGGYTGDCCGAVFLICELSFLITLLACLNS